jgi:hypothetical protein
VNATPGFGGSVTFACSDTAQLTCSFSPSTVQPTATSPQTTNISVTASNMALASPAGSQRDRFLLFALVLPLGLAFGIASKRPTWVMGVAAGLLLFTLALATLSCGGSSGSGGGGGGGSNNYTITVNAIAAGTNTTRTLGTVNVTVTH